MMVPKSARTSRSFRALLVPLFLYAFTLGAAAFAQTTVTHSTAGDIKAFFQKKQKTVLTFVGYSGAGYEDEASMLKQAERILEEFDPAKTIVNIGATPEGIGAIYAMAKRNGFPTTGIVSSQATRYNVKLSPHVDHVFYVKDSTWGGFLAGTGELSPTSKAMVENSDIIIGIGGGGPTMSLSPQNA